MRRGTVSLRPPRARRRYAPTPYARWSSRCVARPNSQCSHSEQRKLVEDRGWLLRSRVQPGAARSHLKCPAKLRSEAVGEPANGLSGVVDELLRPWGESSRFVRIGMAAPAANDFVL